MYGVLGLDPISPEENDFNIYEAKSATNNGRNGGRAYGLGNTLFMTEAESTEAETTYHKVLDWHQKGFEKRE